MSGWRRGWGYCSSPSSDQARGGYSAAERWAVPASLDPAPRVFQTRRMQRRQFLRSLAFAGTAGLILPRTRLFGADAPSKKLNIALLGTWGRGEAHFAGMAEENVVALCDVN